MLEVSRLKAWYDLTQALFDISFELRSGETLALVGANGGGKTTIMRAILGLVRTEGSITVDGVRIDRMPTVRRVREIGIGVVHEGRGLFPEMSVRENLIVGLRRRETTDLSEVLDLFPPLQGRLDEMASNLSGGEQQMVALGRALVRKPRLLLLDEPSLGLAPAVVEQIYGLLATVRDSGPAILLTEQSSVRAGDFADRVCEVKTGATTNGTAAAPSLPQTVRTDAEE